MEIPDWLTKIMEAATWPAVGILCAFTVYHAVKEMLPVWAERYKLQTKNITTRDAQRFERAMQKVNGAFVEQLVNHFSGSWQLKRFLDSWLNESNFARNLLQQGTSLSLRLDGHETEDRAVHDRVRALEVHVETLKTNVAEIKSGQKELRDLVENKADLLRDKLADAESRILNLLERRREPRG